MEDLGITMKIFVTGHLGYIGRILTQVLVNNGFEVVGCDTGFFPANFIKDEVDVKNINKDIRDLTKDDISGFDAVIHLAALANDPASDLNPTWTEEINYKATIQLAEISKECGVERFILSSSCSVYGASGEKLINEDSETAPLTPYADAKIRSENYIKKLSDSKFAPIVLRNATAFGVSPRMRFDLVVNNMCGYAFTTGEVKILSDGTAWRPNVHIEDISRAIVAVLETPFEDVNGEIFNVGMNSENYQVKDIAKIVASIIPNSEVKFAPGGTKDPRSYRVDFSKIKERIRKFKPRWTVKDGIKEIYEVLKNTNFSKEDFFKPQYHTVEYLKKLIKENKLNGTLRWNV